MYCSDWLIATLANISFLPCSISPDNARGEVAAGETKGFQIPIKH